LVHQDLRIREQDERDRELQEQAVSRLAPEWKEQKLQEPTERARHHVQDVNSDSDLPSFFPSTIPELALYLLASLNRLPALIPRID